jgi:hypothetical protein
MKDILCLSLTRPRSMTSRPTAVRRLPSTVFAQGKTRRLQLAKRRPTRPWVREQSEKAAQDVIEVACSADHPPSQTRRRRIFVS